MLEYLNAPGAIFAVVAYAAGIALLSTVAVLMWVRGK